MFVVLSVDIIAPFLKKIKDEDIVAQKKENVRLKHAKNLIFSLHESFVIFYYHGFYKWCLYEEAHFICDTRIMGKLLWIMKKWCGP